MNVTVQPLPLAGRLFDEAIRVYAAAFAPPPYSDPGRGEEVRQRIRETHSMREGFLGFVAQDESGRILGIIYGYHGKPGQWWHDAVVRAVDRDTAARWFGDSYELVEVAVDPACQGHGIGQKLIAALLQDRGEATCVLSTRTDSRAHLLYRRLGFNVITEMRFSPSGAPFYVMGRRLPYDVPSAATAAGEEAETAAR